MDKYGTIQAYETFSLWRAMGLVVVEMLLAALAYGAATYTLWDHYVRAGSYGRVKFLAAIGLLVQPVALLHMSLQAGHVVIGLGTALSLFAWQVALLLWLFSLRRTAGSLGALGLVIYPVAAFCAIAGLLIPDPHSAVEMLDWPIQLHIILSMLAYGLLTLGAVQSLAVAIQHRQLQHRPPSGVFTTLPPMETMEALLFRLIGSGFVLLTLAIASGGLFIDHLFEQHLAHKVILSAIAWLIFAGLLLGRWRYGWRGRTAVRGVLAGYVLLVLAYFGSKLVLELILGEHWW